MNTLQQRSLDSIDDLAFDLAGMSEAEALLQRLRAVVETTPFNKPATREEMRAARAAEMPAELVKVELTTGEVFHGKLVRHEPAKLVFKTPDGLREVPFLQIPGELWNCFPTEALVGARDIINASGMSLEEITASMTQMNEQMTKTVIPMVREICRHSQAVQRENIRLENENAELRARLQEGKG